MYRFKKIQRGQYIVCMWMHVTTIVKLSSRGVISVNSPNPSASVLCRRACGREPS